MTRNIQATDAQGNKVDEPILINGVDPTSSGGGGGAFEDGDGDGIYTLPSTGDGIDVASVGTDNLSRTNIGSKAYLSANQTISANTKTKIAFDSEDYDNEGEFDTTNNQFVATDAGTYRINVALLYDNAISSGVTTQCDIYINGSEMVDSRIQTAISDYITVRALATIELAANDTIEIYTYHGDSVSVDLHSSGTSRNTYVEIEQVG